MSVLCQECPNKSLCKCLCPEAEAYVNQDSVSQRELNISTPFSGLWPNYTEKSIFTPTERKILHALLDGNTRDQIAKLLGITRESLRKHIQNLRKKHNQEIPSIEE